MIIRATNLLRAAALILIAGVGTFSMPVQRAEAACMPSALAATLNVIRSKFGPVQVISAHRPGARIAGSGKASYHASCRAVDFNPPAGRYSEVVSWLKANHNGGVGTYSCGMNHIHIDTGPRYRFHKCQGGGGSRYVSRASKKRYASGRSHRSKGYANARSYRSKGYATSGRKSRRYASAW